VNCAGITEDRPTQPTLKIQIKSNQIIYLDKQIQKNVDKMSNEKA